MSQELGPQSHLSLAQQQHQQRRPLALNLRQQRTSGFEWRTLFGRLGQQAHHATKNLLSSPPLAYGSHGLVCISKSLFLYESVMAEDLPHTEQQMGSLETNPLL